MAGHALLTRIRQPRYAQPRQKISEAEVRDSVLRHLQQMCLTRLGSMLTCADYGVLDVADLIHAFPEAGSVMAQSIRHTIARYEPRLSNVRVRFSPADAGELVLRFEVTAHMRIDGGIAPVAFHTSVDPSRRVSVS